ncbi:class I SAM-dependent methyltransferase [Bacillus sp. AK128]
MMFEWHNEAAKQWDDKADFWNQSSKDMWNHGSRQTIIPFLKKYSQSGSILDAGCGDGYGSLLLDKQGFQVTGVDVSANMIDKARKLNHDTSSQFLKADIASLPFPDGTFDAIMAINSLEWTVDPLHVLKEFSRVLKTSGVLCIGILGPTAGPRHNSLPRLYGENVICNTMMPWEFEKLAKDDGYHLVDAHGVYKKEVKPANLYGLSTELHQALSFMWVSIFEKGFVKEHS